MQIATESETPTCPEPVVFERLLQLAELVRPGSMVRNDRPTLCMQPLRQMQPHAPSGTGYQHGVRELASVRHSALEQGC